MSEIKNRYSNRSNMFLDKIEHINYTLIGSQSKNKQVKCKSYTSEAIDLKKQMSTFSYDPKRIIKYLNHHKYISFFCSSIS